MTSAVSEDISIIRAGIVSRLAGHTLGPIIDPIPEIMADRRDCFIYRLCEIEQAGVYYAFVSVEQRILTDEVRPLSHGGEIARSSAAW